jgi:hypothetical protein
VPNDSGGLGVCLPVGTALGSTSVTEFEFRHAAQLEKPILVFLLDPEAEWPSTFFDAMSGDGHDGKAVSNFRQEIGRRYLVNHFRTADELASLVGAAIYRLEMNRQMNLKALRVEPRFNQPFVRNGPVQDSALHEIKNIIVGPEEIQAVQINIGQGVDWWMTRLYFLSSIASDLKAIECIVFLGEGDTFFGMLNPVIVKERLAQIFSYISEYETALSQAGVPNSDLAIEVDRRAKIWESQMQASLGSEHSNPTFVTRTALQRWFTPYLIEQAIEIGRDDNAALEIQRVMDWPLRFVPLQENGRFARVIDKTVLAEQIARIFVREQVSRALSMTR